MFLAFAASGCAGAAPVQAPPPPRQTEPMAQGAESAQPGLATSWGEQRQSQATTVAFQRADATQPFALGSLFYNDEAGAKALAGTSGGATRTTVARSLVGGGLVSLQLRGERGEFLSGFTSGDRQFAVGEKGTRYSIVLQNQTDSRIECVVSVDGLDVINGQPAGFGNRGYLVDPRGEIEIDGFRTSTDAVAAFRFGSVSESYAQKKHGDSRNVGVIGVALFHEHGRPVPTLLPDAKKRLEANPFPGQFATPP